MKKKTKVALKAIGLYLAMNALRLPLATFCGGLPDPPSGHWLEIDKPTKPYVPGTLVVLQIFPLMIAYFYYRDKVKGA